MSHSAANDVRVSRLSGSGQLHIHVRERQPGRGMPVIFVHGFIGDGAENHRLFIRLADVFVNMGFCALLFDQYGSGYSDGEHKDVCLATCREDILTVIQWAVTEYGPHYGLVAQSVGSAVVLEMAEGMISECEFRIMLNPAARFNEWLLERYGWHAAMGDGSTEDVLCAQSKGVMVAKRYVEELLSWDWLNVLQESKIPTLIVASGDDELRSDDVAREAGARLGTATDVRYVAGANHTYSCQPHEEHCMHKLVEEWVASVSTCFRSTPG